MLASFGLGPSQVAHYHRVLRAAIHGFVTLRQQVLMTRDADPDHSFVLMIDLFTDSLDALSPVTDRGDTRPVG